MDTLFTITNNITASASRPRHEKKNPIHKHMDTPKNNESHT